MKISIVIPTYRRSDNKTPEYLIRALTSIKNQTYQNYKVFLIGDNYDNNDEFVKIASTIIDSKKITYINLPNAIEREKYQTGEKLWSSGGANATNYGINLALNDGYSYICHLDHDDWWEPNHLDLIKDQLNNNFIIIATKARYLNGEILPINGNNPFYPKGSNLIHSATCVNFREIPLRYRDVFAEEGYPYAGDADLWDRLSKYMLENNKMGYLINEITCHHDEEGFSRK
jgi:glycosyltransferase involved in cell wall biosynthesis